MHGENTYWQGREGRWLLYWWLGDGRDLGCYCYRYHWIFLDEIPRTPPPPPRLPLALMEEKHSLLHTGLAVILVPLL